MARKRARRAFVLVMVLAVLAMAGAALGIAARASARRALAAASAQRQLQLKWGVLSCRSLLLPRAEQVLAAEEAARGAAVRRAVRSVVLGSVRVRAIVCDEQALLNINMLAQRYGTANVASYVGRVQPTDGTLRVCPLPIAPQPSEISSFPGLFASFDQVWAYDYPSQLIGAKDGAPQREITCWSSGKVHFKRASPDVLRQAAAGVLTEYQRSELVRFCGERPDCTLSEAIRHLQLTDEAVRGVESVLTGESLCHGLWVIVEDGDRTWYRFFVRRTGDPENDTRSWAFQW